MYWERINKSKQKSKAELFCFNVNRKHNILLLQIDIIVNLIWIVVHSFDENYEIVRIHFGVIYNMYHPEMCRISFVQFSMVIV